MNKNGQMVFVIVMCIIWTIYATIKTLLGFLKRPSTYFQVKPRPNMPPVLKRWKHGYVTIPVKCKYKNCLRCDLTLMYFAGCENSLRRNRWRQ